MAVFKTSFICMYFSEDKVSRKKIYINNINNNNTLFRKNKHCKI